MKPGRELDALVAEKVMGWSLGCRGGKSNHSPTSGTWSREKDPMEGVPYYSTDIAAAFEIIEHLSAYGRPLWQCELRIIRRYNIREDATEWGVSLSRDGGNAYYSKSLPHAVCLSALKACNAS